MMKKMIDLSRILRAVIFISLSLCCASCKTTSSLISPDLQVEADYQIVKIDLTQENLVIKSFAKTKGFVNPKKFARDSGCQLVFNTTPFKKDGSPVGLIIQEGQLISPAQKKYAALCFYKEEKGFSAQIFDSQEEVNLETRPPYLAFGGFWTILRDEEIYEFIDRKDYRMAAGLSSDGKTLWLLAGKALSFGDCALIFKKNGAAVAMEFDGGSSMWFVLNEKSLFPRLPHRRVSSGMGFILPSE
jgi:uncharacterized protein YigE (DUF2233 family)